MEDMRRAGRGALRPHLGLLGLVSPEAGPKPARVVAFLQVDPEADLARLTSHGVEVNGGGTDIRTGIVDLEGLDGLSQEPAIRPIVPARRLRPLMDVALGKVGLPAFRTSSGLSGRNVVVGMVDTGIEAAHPAFSG